MNIEAIPNRNPYMHPEMERFFICAIRDGALLEKGFGSRGPGAEGRRERQWETFVRYYYTPASYREIARTLEISQEGVRQRILTVVTKLYEATSQPIRQQLPSLDEIRLDKPTTVPGSEYFRRRISQGLGGSSFRIEAAIEAGQTTYEQLRTAGFTTSHLTQARKIVKNLSGGAVPYKKMPPKEASKLKLAIRDTSKTDEEVTGILKRVKPTSLLRWMREEDPAVISLYRTVLEAGYRIKPNRLAEILLHVQLSGIPLRILELKKSGGPIRYYVIATQHQERVRQALVR